MGAAWMWFTEYLQSGGDYSKFSDKTGVMRCMYHSGSGYQPNTGAYKANVPTGTSDKATFAKCGLTADEVKSKASLFKKWGILSPTGAEAAALGLWSMEDVSVPFNVSPTDFISAYLFMSPTDFISAYLFIGAIAMVTIGVVMRHKSRPATTQDDEEPLCLE